jgi:hypothetical protein
MKTSSLLFVLFSFVLFTNLARAEMLYVDIALEDVHVPLGFDSNDRDVEIVVTGVVPDTCYRRPQGIAKIEGNQISVDMKATKLVGKDVVCIQAIVPYLVTVSLGQLPEGHYDIKVNKGRESEKESVLLVDKPNAQSIDNFTYANVTSAETEHNRGTLILKGAHTSSCMNIDRIEVVPNLNGNTLAILPIVRQDLPICDRMMKPFTLEVPIPTSTQNQSMVFHIRKIAGNALNVRW